MALSILSPTLKAIAGKVVEAREECMVRMALDGSSEK